MPGLEDLLGFVFRAVEVAPAYEPRRCLVVTRGTEEACSVCVDVCPHDAVSVRSGRVVIDPVDCTGCGLCVTACPSYALELPPPAPTEGPVRCSKVAGTARSVACLARLSPSDVLAAAGASGEATLARGDCATCRLGGESVPEAVDRVVGMAVRLAAAASKQVEITVEHRPRLDHVGASTRLSRRSLLYGGLREAGQAAATALGPVERFLPGDGDDGGKDVPREHERQLAALAANGGAPTERTPLSLPLVADGCILCPQCSRACPTDALSRVLEPEGGRLVLDPLRCVGCDACVPACPVNVVSMEADVPKGRLFGGTETLYDTATDARRGAVAR